MKKIILITLHTALLLITAFCHPIRSSAQEDWFEKGLFLIRNQQYEEAVKAFTAAIELIPGDFEAHNYRGISRAYLGDYDGAIGDYTKALELKPDYADAYNNRGYAWVKKGNLSMALNDYSRAIEINPVFLDAYTSKAWILATSSEEAYRNGKEAVTLAKKAVEINSNADSLDTLAAAYACVGQFDEAKQTQKRAIRLVIQQESIDAIDPYVERLNAYNAGKPLRIDYAPSSPRSIAGQLLPPSETVAGSNQSVPAARLKPAVEVGPYPYTIQVSAYRDPAKSISAVADLKKKGRPGICLSGSYTRQR